ncbi:hypothetical protein UCMB321_3253 [Pseudomonas batumici]|uniref:Uncharacterized protein n=1 Tax=Pseudomonas batumici TaxID=226910 RepID=A0A0C2EWG0_9PSED|nr:hypothetical protein UCMB321_3253 [Pseudomonas batumici]
MWGNTIRCGDTPNCGSRLAGDDGHIGDVGLAGLIVGTPPAASRLLQGSCNA